MDDDRHASLRHVVIDTNVFISFVTERDAEQQDRADALMLRAKNGELIVVLPQFVIFEFIHAVREFYDLSADETKPLIAETIALPGLSVADDCSWPGVFEHWSDLRPDVVDAAILATAIANRYSLATFDRKLANRARTFGVAPYW
jgi:predicted nucleic acid-binding protein